MAEGQTTFSKLRLDCSIDFPLHKQAAPLCLRGPSRSSICHLSFFTEPLFRFSVTCCLPQCAMLLEISHRFFRNFSKSNDSHLMSCQIHIYCFLSLFLIEFAYFMNLQFFRDSSLYATLPSVGLVPNPPSKVRNTTARPFLRSTTKALKKENIQAVSNLYSDDVSLFRAFS